MGRDRRLDVLRGGFPRHVSSGSKIRGQDPKRRTCRQFANRTAECALKAKAEKIGSMRVLRILTQPGPTSHGVSVGLNASGLDDVGPLCGVVGDEPSEIR